MKTVSIFISHHGEDTWIAEQIASKIRRRGGIPFLDINDIEVGLGITKTILDFLDKSDQLLVIFTPWAMRRPFVWFEIGAAWFRQLRFIVVLYGVSDRDFRNNSNIPDFIKDPWFVRLNKSGIGKYLGELSKHIIDLRKTNRKTRTPRHEAHQGEWKGDIFLSHSREDVKWVSKFAVCLQKKGLKAWYHRDIFPDEKWASEEQREDALINSAYIITILTKSSVDNPRTSFELGVAYAKSHRIMILPQKTKTKKMREILTTFHEIPSFHEGSPSKAANRIAALLRSKTG